MAVCSYVRREKNTMLGVWEKNKLILKRAINASAEIWDERGVKNLIQKPIRSLKNLWIHQNFWSEGIWGISPYFDPDKIISRNNITKFLEMIRVLQLLIQDDNPLIRGKIVVFGRWNVQIHTASNRTGSLTSEKKQDYDVIEWIIYHWACSCQTTTYFLHCSSTLRQHSCFSSNFIKTQHLLALPPHYSQGIIRLYDRLRISGQ